MYADVDKYTSCFGTQPVTKMGGEVHGVTSPGPCGSSEMVAHHNSGAVSVVIVEGHQVAFPFFELL